MRLVGLLGCDALGKPVFKEGKGAVLVEGVGDFDIEIEIEIDRRD